MGRRLSWWLRVGAAGELHDVSATWVVCSGVGLSKCGHDILPLPKPTSLQLLEGGRGSVEAAGMVEVMLKSSVSHVCGAARLFERRGNKHAIVAGSGWASVAAGCKDGCC